MSGITTCLWFSSDLEGALQRYTSLFPDSEVYSLQAGDGYALAEWRMNGTDYRAQRLVELLSDPDPRRAGAAQAAMLTQRRIVVAELEAAADAAC